MSGCVQCHAFRGLFLYVMTPATPVLLTWSALPASRKSAFAVGTGLLGATLGWVRVNRNSAEYCACLIMYDCVKMNVSVSSSCDEGSACRIFQTKERKESFSRDEILGSLEAQGTVGALFPPSIIIPSSCLALSNVVHFLLSCLSSL